MSFQQAGFWELSYFFGGSGISVQPPLVLSRWAQGSALLLKWFSTGGQLKRTASEIKFSFELVAERASLEIGQKWVVYVESSTHASYTPITKALLMPIFLTKRAMVQSHILRHGPRGRITILFKVRSPLGLRIRSINSQLGAQYRITRAMGKATCRCPDPAARHQLVKMLRGP